MRKAPFLIAAALFASDGAAVAQAPDQGALTAAQRAAMAPLSAFLGTWRGPATITLPNGERREIVQTERIGLVADGTLMVIEGRGFNPDGSPGFSAFAVISFEPRSKVYTMQSWSGGLSGSFRFEVTPAGFVWEAPAGPATLRYTTAIENGIWREVGETILPDRPPLRTLDMTLTRLGPTDWPAGGAVPMR